MLMLRQHGVGRSRRRRSRNRRRSPWGTRPPPPRRDPSPPVVETGIDPGLVLPRSATSSSPPALPTTRQPIILRDLTGDRRRRRPTRPTRRSLSPLGPTDIEQADIGRHPRHAEHAVGGRDRRQRRARPCACAGRRRSSHTPASRSGFPPDDVADLERWISSDFTTSPTTPPVITSPTPAALAA